jgi:hypothetical protein
MLAMYRARTRVGALVRGALGDLGKRDRRNAMDEARLIELCAAYCTLTVTVPVAVVVPEMPVTVMV